MGSPSKPGTGGTGGDGSRTAWRLPLTVLIVGMFMSILDISIVTVALPTIQNEFGASTSDAQWVVTAYSLTEGVVVPATAWLGDRFGLSRVYNLTLLGFAGGSALCGLAWSLNTLVIARIVQALLGGILPAITMAILLQIVPRDRLGAALGMYGLGAVVAPAVGPALGGYLVEYVNWRLIFFINVPVSIVGTVAAMLVLPSFPRRVGRRFDVLGFVMVATGLFTLLLALSKGEDWHWTSYRILGLFTVSVLSLALFVVIELEVDDPLLDLRVFRYWAYSLSLALMSLLIVVLFVVAVYVPQFLQLGQGWGALDAGLVVLPPAILMGLLMPITGQIYDRIGPRGPVVCGLAIAAVATYLLHTITLDTSREHLMWLLMLQYGGFGIGMMPLFSAGLAVIPPTYNNTASAFNNVVQRTAAALGVAVFTAILTRQQTELMAGRAALLPQNTPVPHLGPPGTPDWTGLYALYHQTELRVFVGAISNVFLIMAGICALGVLGALLLRSGRAPTLTAETVSPAQPVSQPPPANGQRDDQRRLVPSIAATGRLDTRPEDG
ncbi:MAG: DHA2 family efflux MFS transporter permease subunit [Actinomycetota bacterium]|nr:DHA2 family efflux MFS transporter permease subunit [Actinomycetota bacterium]